MSVMRLSIFSDQPTERRVGCREAVFSTTGSFKGLLKRIIYLSSQQSGKAMTHSVDRELQLVEMVWLLVWVSRGEIYQKIYLSRLQNQGLTFHSPTPV